MNSTKFYDFFCLKHEYLKEFSQEINNTNRQTNKHHK